MWVVINNILWDGGGGVFWNRKSESFSKKNGIYEPSPRYGKMKKKITNRDKFVSGEGLYGLVEKGSYLPSQLNFTIQSSEL